MASEGRKNNGKSKRGRGETGPLIHSMQNGMAALENRQFLIKLNMQLTENQQLHSWVFISEKLKLLFIQKPVHEYS